MNPTRCLILLLLLLTFLLAPTAAQAQVPPPEKPWTNETEFSFVSANGNTKSTSMSGKNKFTYTRSKTTLDLFGGGLGAKSEGSVTAEQYHAGEKVSYKVSDRNYVFEKFQWDKDRFSGIRHRYDTSVGFGRDLVDTPTDKLLAEFGVGWIRENRINSPDEEFSTGRAYSKYERVISPTANFTQDAEYVQNLENRRDIRVKTETALIAALTTNLSLKVSYVWKHVGEPPAAFGRNDTITSVSLIAIY